jgi:hypothetical protein
MKFNSVFIGSGTGSAGNMTATKWKGINVAKAKAVTVANPRSPAQVTQRNRMTFAVALYRQIAEGITRGFKQLAVKRSEFNAFISTNLLNGAVGSNGTTASFTPANFVSVKGTLTPTEVLSTAYNGTGDVLTLTFSDTATGDQSTTDVALLTVVNSLGTKAQVFMNNNRGDGEAIATLPIADWPAGTYYAYLGFYNSGTGKASDSVGVTFTVA